ncbi:hypothetical protein THASP1DRAFT_30794 [Thamnocephalis sphaerospora]|uniref:RING-type domain-containing protein n=1 Tax=Thamnocephalis sphaerospora TaxID=78915 RepID=A0A4P9XN96_9FUNG|nr:hypothetical protein THASP1DRAFT_30794 [Thamnocephalis sphaerospora]|eukprot:RKP07385.1 hypothetical protein THASP1DRAFT_30794 [Thamnocephalis sphaerospora]
MADLTEEADLFFAQALSFLGTLSQEHNAGTARGEGDTTASTAERAPEEGVPSDERTAAAAQRSELVNRTISFLAKLRQEWEHDGRTGSQTAAIESAAPVEANPAGTGDDKTSTLSGESDSCAICLEPVVSGEHAVSKLVCGHEFHLSCVGSYFNCSGKMNCPNCRRDQFGLPGNWEYANAPARRRQTRALSEDHQNADEYVEIPPPPPPPFPLFFGGVDMLRRLMGMTPGNHEEEARRRALAGIEFEPVDEDEEESEEGQGHEAEMDATNRHGHRYYDHHLQDGGAQLPYGNSWGANNGELEDWQQSGMSDAFDDTLDPAEVERRRSLSSAMAMEHDDHAAMNYAGFRHTPGTHTMEWSHEPGHRDGSLSPTPRRPRAYSNSQGEEPEQPRTLQSARRRLLGWLRQTIVQENEEENTSDDDSDVAMDGVSDAHHPGGSRAVAADDDDADSDSASDDGSAESDASNDSEEQEEEEEEEELTADDDSPLRAGSREAALLRNVIRNVTAEMSYSEEEDEEGEDEDEGDNEDDEEEDEEEEEGNEDSDPDANSQQTPRRRSGTPALPPVDISDAFMRMGSTFNDHIRDMEDEVQAHDLSAYAAAQQPARHSRPTPPHPDMSMSRSALQSYHASLPDSSPPGPPARRRGSPQPSNASDTSDAMSCESGLNMQIRHQRINSLSPNTIRHLTSPTRQAYHALSRTSSMATVGEHFFSADDEFDDDLANNQLSSALMPHQQAGRRGLSPRAQLPPVESIDDGSTVRMQRAGSESSTSGYRTCRDAGDLLSSPSSPIPHPHWHAPSPRVILHDEFEDEANQSSVFDEGDTTIVLDDHVETSQPTDVAQPTHVPLALQRAQSALAAFPSLSTGGAAGTETAAQASSGPQSRSLANFHESMRAIQSSPVWSAAARFGALSPEPDYYFAFDDAQGTVRDRFEEDGDAEVDEWLSGRVDSASNQANDASGNNSARSSSAVTNWVATVPAQSHDSTPRHRRRVSRIPRPPPRSRRRSQERIGEDGVQNSSYDARDRHRRDTAGAQGLVPASPSMPSRMQAVSLWPSDMAARPHRARHALSLATAHSYDSSIVNVAGRQRESSVQDGLIERLASAHVEDGDRQQRSLSDAEGVDAANVHRRDPNLHAATLVPSSQEPLSPISVYPPITPSRNQVHGRRRKRRSVSVESDAPRYASTLAEIQQRPRARVHSSNPFASDPLASSPVAASLPTPAMAEKLARVGQDSGRPHTGHLTDFCPSTLPPPIGEEHHRRRHRQSSDVSRPTELGSCILGQHGRDGEPVDEDDALDDAGRRHSSWIANKLRRLSMLRPQDEQAAPVATAETADAAPSSPASSDTSVTASPSL